VQSAILAKSNKINLTESTKFPELSYTMFNVTKEPFNNKNCAPRGAYAVDRVQQKQLRNKDILEWPAVRSDSGSWDSEGHRAFRHTTRFRLRRQYTRDGQAASSSRTLSAGTDPRVSKTIALIKTTSRRSASR